MTSTEEIRMLVRKMKRKSKTPFKGFIMCAPRNVKAFRKHYQGSGWKVMPVDKGSVLGLLEVTA